MQSLTESVRDVGGFIRQQRETAKVSLRELARSAGVSNPYLSQIERGLRKPSAEILAQIAKGLQISAETLYQQAGWLEERPTDSTVVTAIALDPGLGERHKQVLIELYETYCREQAAKTAADTATPAADEPPVEPALPETELPETAPTAPPQSDTVSKEGTP